ncbi:peptidoglycan DD-metalloendopeptidase family protein [Novosphingobium tardum]|uniref:Peptidoglycan DD-metalloendopeptidase family protein n=1 Tax=Novosphingobium tardum TaxID=1538021 RepID=A0ABV8RJ87_9SPHN
MLLSACVSSGERRPERAPPSRDERDQRASYTVRPGDTLSHIAARLGVDMGALARANALPPPYLIRIGQRLVLPDSRRSAPVRPSESRPVVQPLPPRVTDQAPVRRPPSQTPAMGSSVMRPAGAPRFVWPVDGLLAEEFGSGADGRGIAISAHGGTAVRAAAAGTVLFAGEEPSRYGQVVLIDHGAGWVSAYGHLGKLVVSAGEKVGANSRLGFVAPGRPAGNAQLHFELRHDNQPVDPVPLLPPRL